MNLSQGALRDLTALAHFKSKTGMLERQFLQLKEHVIKGHLVDPSTLGGNAHVVAAEAHWRYF